MNMKSKTVSLDEYIAEYLRYLGIAKTARRSYAELADGEKDAISHRGRALEKLAAELPAFLNDSM